MLMANISLITFLKLLAKPFVNLNGYIKRKRDEYEEESQYVEEERERLRQEEEQYGQGTDKERLAKKFSSLDAMTKSARHEKSAKRGQRKVFEKYRRRIRSCSSQTYRRGL